MAGLHSASRCNISLMTRTVVGLFAPGYVSIMAVYPTSFLGSALNGRRKGMPPRKSLEMYFVVLGRLLICSSCQSPARDHHIYIFVIIKMSVLTILEGEHGC